MPMKKVDITNVKNGRVGDNRERKEENKVPKKEGGNLFSIWNVLLAAAVGSLVAITLVLLIAGVSRIPVFISLFIAVYLLLTGKSTEEIVEKVKIRLKEYEGEQLDFARQISIAKSFLDIAIQHKFARYLIVFIANLLVGIFIGIWSLFGFIVALLSLAAILLIAAYYTIKFLKDYFWKNFVGVIEKDPPHLGLLTVLGERKNVVLKEGYALKFPPIFNFIPIKVMRETMDLEEYSGKPVLVFTRDNVTVELEDVTLVYTPDPERLIDFVTFGKHEGVGDALEDLLQADLREFARKLEVEDTKDEKGKVTKEGLLSASRKVTNEILRKLTGVEDDETIKKNLNNGIPDNHLMGIKIFRFSIGPAKPKGEYAKNLEKLSKEKLQRIYETYEARTEGLRALAYFMSSRGKDISGMTPKDIEDYVSKKVEKDPAFKEDFMQLLTLVLDYKTEGVIPGLGDRLRRGESIPLDVIGGLISGLLEKPSGKKKPREERGDENKKSKGEEEKEESEE